MSYLNEQSFKALGLVAPPGKAMELAFLLLCWTAAIVFLVVAWTRVGEVKDSAEAYTTTVQDKLTQHLTLMSFVAVFVLLTFFLTLRVALAPAY
jgi:hypothetical protein